MNQDNTFLTLLLHFPGAFYANLSSLTNFISLIEKGSFFMGEKQGFKVRFGSQEDLPAVMELIRELAEYEKAAHEVANTLENLTTDFDDGWFKLLVAESSEGEVLGMALYHDAYSTWKGKMWYLDDLVVKAAFRGFGIGRSLIIRLLELAKAGGVHAVKWQVLDWNTPAIDLYKKIGADIDTHWYNCKILV